MEKRYTVGEFARIAGMAVVTLQKWDRDGKLKACRTITNRRYYTDEHIEQLKAMSKGLRK